MNILKVLGVVVGIHGVAYLVIAQPGCRSTAKPAPTATEAARVAPVADEPATPVAAQPINDGYSAVALNLPFAQTTPPAGDRFTPTRPGAEPTPVASTPAKTYTVQKGDSFYTIARKNGITVNELAAANNLASSASLRPGQKLVIPVKGGKGPAAAEFASAAGTPAPVAGGATYTVKSGDTLSKIASRHRTTAAALRSLNGISGDHLRIGQTLQLPGNGAAAAPAPGIAPAPAPTAVPTTSVVSSAPVAPGVHTVSLGETAESIARRYRISVNELARANPGQLSDPRKIRVGQVLNIPGAGAASAAKPPPSLVPESEPFPATPVEAVTPVTPIAPLPGQELDQGVPSSGDAPVIRVDEPPPAVPAPQID